MGLLVRRERHAFPEGLKLRFRFTGELPNCPFIKLIAGCNQQLFIERSQPRQETLPVLASDSFCARSGTIKLAHRVVNEAVQ
jgi:hypothetical protein